MIKLVTFLKRSDALEREGFVHRWLTKHAPMAAIFPGLRAYRLSGAMGPDAPADAFAELWFDTREACQAAYSSDVGRAGSSDANAYTSRRRQALLDEKWLSSPSDRCGVKVVLAAKRGEGESRDGFIAWWTTEMAGKAAAAAGARPAKLCTDGAGLVLDSDPGGSRGLVAGEGETDGLIEIWAEDDESAEALAARFGPLRGEADRRGCTSELLLLRENRIV